MEKQRKYRKPISSTPQDPTTCLATSFQRSGSNWWLWVRLRKCARSRLLKQSLSWARSLIALSTVRYQSGRQTKTVRKHSSSSEARNRSSSTVKPSEHRKVPRCHRKRQFLLFCSRILPSWNSRDLYQKTQSFGIEYSR